MSTAIVHKFCTKCQQHLPQEAFDRDKHEPDGRRHRCKQCRVPLQQAINKRYRDKHKAEAVVRSKNYREQHKDTLPAKKKAYAQANKQAVNAYHKAYWERNKKRKTAYYKAWRKKNKEKCSSYAAQRRARLARSMVNDFTAEQWIAMKEHYKHRCVYCGKKQQRLTMDHITPLSKGGAHTLSNIVPACKSCNCTKKAGAVLQPIQPVLLIA